MRIRGRIDVRSDTANHESAGAIGIGVFPGALTSGLIGPVTHRHEDWMYWRSLYISEPDNTAEFRTERIDVDVRAKRKLEELEEDLVMVIENTGGVAGFNFHVHYGLSILIALQ